MEVVYILQSCSSKLQELLVVVNHDNSELGSRRVDSRTRTCSICGKHLTCDFRQLNLTLVVHCQAVLNIVLCSLLWVLQIHLHISHTGDNLQHLRVEGVKLLLLFKRFLFLCEVSYD